MSTLADQALQDCNASSSGLSDKDIEKHLQDLDGWDSVTRNNISQLRKIFMFKNFILAQAFANQVADLSELNNHHPCICFEWGKVEISWWTHSVSGLFINDFIMAAKTDAIYGKNSSDQPVS